MTPLSWKLRLSPRYFGLLMLLNQRASPEMTLKAMGMNVMSSGESTEWMRKHISPKP